MLRINETYITYKNFKLLWTIDENKNTAITKHTVAETKKVNSITETPNIEDLNFKSGITTQQNTFVISDYRDFCEKNKNVKLYSYADFYHTENNGSKILRREEDERKKNLVTAKSVINLVNYFDSGKSPTKPSSQPGSKILHDATPKMTVAEQRPIQSSLKNKKGKEKEKENGKDEYHTSDSSEEGSNESGKFLDIYDLLKKDSSQSETFAYSQTLPILKSIFKKDLTQTAIATNDLLMRFKKAHNTILSTEYLTARMQLLKNIIDFFNLVYEDMSEISQTDVPEDGYAHLRSYLTQSLILAFSIKHLEIPLDHEDPLSSTINCAELQIQFAASQHLEDMRVHTITHRFAKENLPAFFAKHLEKYDSTGKYQQLFENLCENVKETGACLRAIERNFTDFKLRIYNSTMHGCEENSLFDFVSLEAIAKRIFPDEFLITKEEQSFNLRDAFRHLLIDCLIAIHSEAASPHNESTVFKFHHDVIIEDLRQKKPSVFIKTYHADALIELLNGFLKIDLYQRDNKKYLTNAEKIFKELTHKKQHTLLLNQLREWLVGIQKNIDEISLESLEKQDNEPRFDCHEVMPYLEQGEASEEKTNAPHQHKEEKKKGFSLSLSQHRFFKFKKSKKSKSPTASHSVLPDIQHKNRSKSFDDRQGSFVNAKENNGINLDISKLLEKTSFKGGTHIYRKSLSTTDATIKRNMDELVVTSQTLIHLKYLENCSHFFHQMDQRMTLLNDLIIYFDHAIKHLLSQQDVVISGSAYDGIKEYLANAIETALANTFLDFGLDHELISYPQEPIPEFTRAHLYASTQLENTRVQTLARGFALAKLPGLLQDYIRDHKSKKYEALFEKLSMNIKETGKCIRKNHHNLGEYAYKVKSQSTLEVPLDHAEVDLHDELFDYVPLEAVIHQIIPTDCIDSRKKCSLQGSLKNLLVAHLLEMCRHANVDHTVTINSDEHKIYIQKLHTHSLVMILRTALKLDKHEKLLMGAEYDEDQYGLNLGKSVAELATSLSHLLELWQTQALDARKNQLDNHEESCCSLTPRLH